MRNTLLQLHLYLGLACAAYLVVFGISSLHINHEFSWMKPANREESRVKHLQIPAIDDDQVLAEAIRDSLGLMGWTPSIR